MRKYRRLVPALGLVLATAYGCADEEPTDPESPTDPAPASPEPGFDFASVQKVESTPELVAKGKEVFSTRCFACHGAEGEGKVGMGPALASKTFLSAASDEMLAKTIAEGRAGTTMIPWKSALQKDEFLGLIAYIRSLAEHEPAELDERPLDGDAAKGEELYRSICARCHGNSGSGYAESSSGTGIGRKGFLDVASNGYIRYLVKHGKSQTQMRPFEKGAPTAVANLEDKEIDSIIAYLREKAW